jgi:hypothetical protein
MAEITRNPRPLFVTSLPTGYDGQEVFFQSTTAGTGGGASNSMADVGAVWHLRYRAAAAGSYKWEFVGGGNLIASVATSETTTSTSYADLATVGPVITLPLAGDYKIVTTASAANSVATNNNAISFSVSGGAANTAVDADSLRLPTVLAGVLQAGSVVVSKAGLTATAVTMRYRVNAGTGTIANRVLTAVPIRVG